MSDLVHVIGAGLAGCEAAWQIAQRGIQVVLVEMKPKRMSPAHHSALFAELVCSNSLRSDRIQNAVGLLKEEMRSLNSLIMQCADATRVPAGGALAVDRVGFSERVTNAIRNHPMIRVEEREADAIPEGIAVVAGGPLASDRLCEAISALEGVGTLNFYDAAAPIVTKASIDMSKVFRASRYDRDGGADYLNCPMNRETYFRFVDALVHAETVEVHGFEENKVFEGCMPVESMAKRGPMTLAYGPLKPAGLKKHMDEPLFANVQLRQDDAGDTMYNLVGFQTRLKFPEQKRVFGMIPGLEKAEFVRYGVMHRNTFLHSPGFLSPQFETLSRPGLFFAGQITGVEGYVESAASGLYAGICAARRVQRKPLPEFGRKTAIGALGAYVSAANREFQPMNITFSLMEPAETPIKDKAKRTAYLAERALQQVENIKKEYELEVNTCH